MENLKGEAYRTILKLPEGIEIKVNILNWVLFIPPRHYFYFPTLEQLLDDLLLYKVKYHAIQSDSKDINHLKAAIEKARKEIYEIMKPLMTIKSGV